MNKTELLEKWLEQRRAEYIRQAMALTADDRADEAKFPRIQANVFDIFQTVLTAGRDYCADEPAVMLFFRERLRQIPANWEAAYDRAAVHGDDTAAHIETLKLDAVRQIREEVTKLWEE